MEKNEVLEMLQTKTYDFLRTNEHLKDKILFLCLGGSHSYGTNVEDSDVDIRGVALDTADDILGISNFEQFVNAETDTVIYSFTKFLKLASECNPNVVEMLFCKPEHYFYITPLGQFILDNKFIFLSQKARYTFGGYARAQLNRLENFLARNAGEILTAEQVQTHIKNSVDNAREQFEDRYGINRGDVETFVDKDKEGVESIYTNINFKHVKLSCVKEMVDGMTQVLKDYEKSAGPRNTKKDDLHLNKHMMHLVRLYLMAIEIFETNNLHTYREKDHDLLMSIRRGNFRTAEGGVKPEFYSMLSDLEKKLDESFAKTTLPKKVQVEKIAQLQRYGIMKYVFNQDVANPF